MTPLPVTTDFAGVEHFAYLLFARATREDSPPPRQASRLHAAAINPSRIQENLGSPEVAAPAQTPLRAEAQSLSPVPQRGTRDTRPSLTGLSFIPLAYRLWLAHLFWLEDVLHTLDCRPSDVTGVELAGLQAVARARARFLQTHDFCPHCQAANPRWGLPKLRDASSPPRCRRCHQEL